jgi:hypothetical protein
MDAAQRAGDVGAPGPEENEEHAMAEDSTRRLLKTFGIAVTNLEDALEAGQAETARKAEAELRECLRDVIELVERLSQRARSA